MRPLQLEILGVNIRRTLINISVQIVCCYIIVIEILFLDHSANTVGRTNIED